MKRPVRARLFQRFATEASVTALLLITLAGLWFVTVVRVEQASDKTTLFVRGELNNRSQILSSQWSMRLSQINLLHYLARGVTHPGPADDAAQPAPQPSLEELRRTLALPGFGIFQVAALNADGVLQWSTRRADAPPDDLSNRTYYYAIRYDGAQTSIGEPILGQISGTRIIPFASAIRDADGHLTGITVVALDATILSPIAPDGSIEPGEVVTLARGDGLTLARSDNRRPSALPDMRRDWLIADARRNGLADGLLRAPLDDVPRFYSARRVNGADLVVVVSLDQDTALADVRQSNDQKIQWVVVVSLILILFAIATAIAIRHTASLKRARAQARAHARQEAQWRQIAEQITDLVSVSDAMMRTLYINPVCVSLLGTQPRRLVGRRFTAQVHPEDLPAVEAALTALTSEGGTQRFCCRRCRPDGGFRWLEYEMVAVDGDSGAGRTGRLYIAVGRDITGRRQSEDALRESQAQLQTLLRQGSGLLYRRVIGADQNAGSGPGAVNQREVVISAHSPSLLLGHPPQQFTAPGFFLQHLHPADLGVVIAAQRRCAATGEATAEYRFKSTSGQYGWLREQLTLAHQTTDQNEIVSYVTDITAEYEVRLRLQLSERLATLGAVTTSIAHEINRPLAVINLAAENALFALENRPGKLEPIADKLKRIIENAKRLAKVMNHVRSFGRAEPSPLEPLDLPLVLDNVLSLAEGRLAAARVTATTHLDPGLAKPIGIWIALEQVLLNLIINACDAYDTRPPTPDRDLQIRARCEGGTIVISVADHAGGIDEALISRIFDPFFTTKKAGVGTGIGLSISLAYLHEMGGSLTAHNEAGGAVFEVRLAAMMTAEQQPPADLRIAS